MYPKNFFANTSIKPRSGRCFVIMPFAEKFDDMYETIQRAVEGPDLGFTCARSDRLQGAGQIIEGVLREIAQCEVLIADLSDRNPNVFYELGSPRW